MKNFPSYRQLDEMDCGPTCLQIISKFYNRYYTVRQLREKAFPTREGTSLLGLSEAAEAIGFRTIGVEVPIDVLEKEATLPCILHWNQKHFVVLYKVSKTKFFLSDPAVGLISYSKSEFSKRWLRPNIGDAKLGVALLLEPLPKFYEYDSSGIEQASKKKSLRYLFDYVRNYKKYFLQLLVGLLAGSLIQLAFPFLTQAIVDVGVNTQNINFIYLVLGAQVMLFVGRTSVDFIRRWILLHLSTRVNVSLISDFLIKLFKLPISFFESKMIGDILRRIEDHSRIEKLLSTSSLTILFSFFNLVTFGLVLLIYSVQIFLVFFGISALYVIFIVQFMGARSRLDYKRFQQLSDNQSNLIQTVQGMIEIKMNTCETLKRWEWERIQARIFRVSSEGIKLQQYQDAGSLLLNESKNMIITVIAALSVIDGSMTLGMMLAVQYVVGQLNVPINDFIGFSRDVQDAKISLTRIGEIHEIENEEDGQKTVDVDDLVGSITLSNVSFSYGGPGSAKVLDDISLTIPEGKVTAIVGASGSGKTTLMKLLLKVYKPSNGIIKIGQLDLRSISTAAWRKNCGVVMQDGYIFSDTITRNIALGDEYPEWKKLRHAARAANIQSTIEELPLAYNTKIGMNGVGLSEGQKQRLLIARAVYKKPGIFFFDEATSSLDTINEGRIMNNLATISENKTMVVIAHRLSTIMNADQIVVMENGKVHEIGTHEELKANRGIYFDLIQHQMEADHLV